MRANRASLFRIAALAALVAALLILVGCSPLPRATPTVTTPTAGAIQTFTPTATEPATTARPGTTPSPTAGATSTPLPAPATSTPVPLAPSATPQPTDTPAAPTATLRPTNTAVPPSATPSLTPTSPPPTITDWRGEYFDGRELRPPAVVVRNDRVVDFRWDAGQSPAPGVPSENYAVRWTRDWTFETGNYRFQVVVDDGARLWVGGNLIIDAWADGAPREYAATLYLQGQVPIRLEYYNHLGSGRARLQWDRVTRYPDWLGSYYKGTELTGLPHFQRNDPSIDFNWGAGAPRADMPADNFSVRWSRRVNLDRAGTYRFQIEADDGVRFWVDGRLVVDDWQDGYTTHDTSLDLTAGGHDLRLDYYERLGGALIRLAISYVSTPPTATFTPTATSTPTATGQPPTATSTPTPVQPTSPPSLQPRISVEPIPGEQGRALRVTGSGWPANTAVDLFLSRIGPDGELSTSVGQATTDPQGGFQARVDLPLLEGLGPGERLEIVARTADGAYEARAPFAFVGTISPTVPVPPQVTPRGEVGGPRSVPFDPIQTSAERFALAEPAYLALDSAQAWAQHFGPEAPPASPPVDWEREYVLGAFLGAQPAGVGVEVESVVARNGTVVVQLSPATPAEGQQNLPRALIRVSRADVARAVGAAAAPTFAFVDASGLLLAQGAPGPEPLGAQMAMQAAPAPAEPGALALPGGEESAQPTPEPEAQAEALKDVPAEEEMPAAAEPTAQAGIQAAAAPRTAALGWGVLALWVIVIAALAVGAWLLIRRLRRD